MIWTDATIDPRAPEQDDRAIGFVDFAAWPDVRTMALPPWPVIGIGTPDHPLASVVDAVCEPPIGADALVRVAAGRPHAAAVATQLLRATRTLPPADALTVESLAYATLQGGAEHGAWLAARPRVSAAPGVVHIERTGGALTVLLDRPHALNAIDRPMRDALHEAFRLAEIDRSIARVSIAATGRAFSMGGDLAEFGTTRDTAAAHAIRMARLPARPLAAIADRVSVHIAGGCVGAGLEMAAFAGRVTASPDAWFQLPELAMGLIPGAGGTVSVPRRIGRSRALLLMLSGRRIGAATARDWGLIDAIVDEPAADQRRRDADGGKIAAR
jgi:enoyl-CoA hydratase/carnithine racemase